MDKQNASWEKKEFWILRHKEKDSLLVIPNGDMEFDNKADAEKALKDYRYKSLYYPLVCSKMVRESKSKVDDFINS